MNYTKFFIFTEGTVIIRDDTGLEIQFEDDLDFTRCTGYSLAGKVYLQYEPEILFFEDSEDPTVTADDIPYAPFEAMIADIPTLLNRKDDYTYNTTEAESVPRLQDQLVKELCEVAADKRDIAEAQPVAGFTPDEVGTYNEERVYRLEYISAKTAMGLTMTQSETDFLLQNKPFWEYQRDVSAVLNQAIGIVKGYTTNAECLAFDPETSPPWVTWVPPVAT